MGGRPERWLRTGCPTLLGGLRQKHTFPGLCLPFPPGSAARVQGDSERRAEPAFPRQLGKAPSVSCLSVPSPAAIRRSQDSCRPVVLLR